MANVMNSANAALARSRQWRHYTPKGMCAQHVWSALTSERFRVGIADADAAWDRATQREYDKNPPAGAPVYWAVTPTSQTHGHIAISAGNGRVRSTDYPRDTELGECTIEEMGKRWPNMVYRGWSRDFCGYPIPGLEKKVTPPKPPVSVPPFSKPAPPASIPAKVGTMFKELFNTDDIAAPAGTDPKNPRWTFGSYIREGYHHLRQIRVSQDESLKVQRAILAELQKANSK